MRSDARGVAQNLVGDGAALDEDVLLLGAREEQRVFVEGEGVAETAGGEEEGVESARAVSPSLVLSFLFLHSVFLLLWRWTGC